MGREEKIFTYPHYESRVHRRSRVLTVATHLARPQQVLERIHLSRQVEDHILIADAVCAIRTRADACSLSTPFGALVLLAFGLDVGKRTPADGSSVAEVDVDTSKRFAVGSRDVEEFNMSLNR